MTARLAARVRVTAAAAGRPARARALAVVPSCSSLSIATRSGTGLRVTAASSCHTVWLGQARTGSGIIALCTSEIAILVRNLNLKPVTYVSHHVTMAERV